MVDDIFEGVPETATKSTFFGRFLRYSKINYSFYWLTGIDRKSWVQLAQFVYLKKNNGDH